MPPSSTSSTRKRQRATSISSDSSEPQPKRPTRESTVRSRNKTKPNTKTKNKTKSKSDAEPNVEQRHQQLLAEVETLRDEHDVEGTVVITIGRMEWASDHTSQKQSAIVSQHKDSILETIYHQMIGSVRQAEWQRLLADQFLSKQKLAQIIQDAKDDNGMTKALTTKVPIPVKVFERMLHTFAAMCVQRLQNIRTTAFKQPISDIGDTKGSSAARKNDRRSVIINWIDERDPSKGGSYHPGARWLESCVVSNGIPTKPSNHRKGGIAPSVVISSVENWFNTFDGVQDHQAVLCSLLHSTFNRTKQNCLPKWKEEEIRAEVADKYSELAISARLEEDGQDIDSIQDIGQIIKEDITDKHLVEQRLQERIEVETSAAIAKARTEAWNRWDLSDRANLFSNLQHVLTDIASSYEFHLPPLCQLIANEKDYNDEEEDGTSVEDVIHNDHRCKAIKASGKRPYLFKNDTAVIDSSQLSDVSGEPRRRAHQSTNVQNDDVSQSVPAIQRKALYHPTARQDESNNEFGDQAFASPNDRETIGAEPTTDLTAANLSFQSEMVRVQSNKELDGGSDLNTSQDTARQPAIRRAANEQPPKTPVVEQSVNRMERLEYETIRSLQSRGRASSVGSSLRSTIASINEGNASARKLPSWMKASGSGVEQQIESD